MPNYYLGLRKIVAKLLFGFCESSAKLVFGLKKIVSKLLFGLHELSAKLVFGFKENSCQIIIWAL